MNIEDCIEVLQAFKAGKFIQWRRIGEGNWRGKGPENDVFNFSHNEYRIAPDVVYKIECDGNPAVYDTHGPAYNTKAKYTQGYWVEGEL